METLVPLTQQLLRQIDLEQSAEAKFRLRAAVCALAGDEKGCVQNLAASKLPQADWDAAKSGAVEY